MNWDDEEESVFEQALRADLPTLTQQNRMRQRILAAGVAAGTALGSTTVAAATPASFGASALSKLSALSWPAKIGLTAALAAPVAGVALPLLHAPLPPVASVARAQSNMATPSAKSARSAGQLAARSVPVEAQPSVRSEPPVEPLVVNTVGAAPRAAQSAGNNAPKPSTATATATATLGNASNAAPSAVIAFDSIPEQSRPSAAEPLRNESTLSAETQLLDRAFAALAANDRASATALVAEHARRFPNGLLRQERERARARLTQELKGD